MEAGNVLWAFGLTLFAGLCSGIGGLITIFCRKTNYKLLSFILGFSAGIMIYVSFVELLPDSQSYLIDSLGHSSGLWISTVAFFWGVFLIFIINKTLPSGEFPHEPHPIEEMYNKKNGRDAKLMRTGIVMALILAIHNFPEGIASFTSAIVNPSLGIAVALSIALHNIPEGIAIAIPVYYASKNMKKAVGMSFLSGLAEPFGALVGYLLLMPFLNDILFGILFGVVSGIMIFISFDELLPTSEKYGEHNYSIWGFILGMMVMALSVLVLS